MKHAIWGMGLWLALTGMLFAQRRGGVTGVIGGGFGHRISPSGFGNILYPGTGGPPSIPNPFYRHPTTFAQRLGANVSGFPGYPIGGRSAHGRGHFAGAVPVVVPYAVPFYAGYSGYGYDYGYAAPPSNVTVVSPPQPSVIINQYYTPEKVDPVMHDYTQTPLPESGNQDLRSYQAPIPSFPEGRKQKEEVSPSEARATIYLIALKSQAIYPAIAYWLEGDTVHYITPQGTHNQVSFSLVDRDFSEELNRERNIEFNLGLPR